MKIRRLNCDVWSRHLKAREKEDRRITRVLEVEVDRLIDEYIKKQTNPDRSMRDDGDAKS